MRCEEPLRPLGRERGGERLDEPGGLAVRRRGGVVVAERIRRLSERRPGAPAGGRSDEVVGDRDGRPQRLERLVTPAKLRERLPEQRERARLVLPPSSSGARSRARGFAHSSAVSGVSARRAISARAVSSRPAISQVVQPVACSARLPELRPRRLGGAHVAGEQLREDDVGAGELHRHREGLPDGELQRQLAASSAPRPGRTARGRRAPSS